MSKKTLMIVVVATVIVAAGAAVYFLAFKNQKQEAPQEETVQNTTTTLDAAIRATIENLKPTCATFLAGELSGTPASDCPGFSNPINKNLCFYCYAAKNQDKSLCAPIDADSGFKTVCLGVTGSTLEEILKP